MIDNDDYEELVGYTCDREQMEIQDSALVELVAYAALVFDVYNITDYTDGLSSDDIQHAAEKELMRLLERFRAETNLITYTKTRPHKRILRLEWK